jgi:hypothetical protein
MAMRDIAIAMETNRMGAGKSMSQINSYAESNKYKLCREMVGPNGALPDKRDKAKVNPHKTGILA